METTLALDSSKYCGSLTAYQRRETVEVKIGDTPMGGKNPIRVQSMTTVDTMDTMGSVEETLRMVASGCEYVRITAPSVKEAENLAAIKKELLKRGCKVPLVADIHFTPNAAETAARIVEKVRINPGNYADKKKFETIEYNDSSYQAELDRIRKKFLPLIKICKEYGTAMRIGTNHGSLSDRIMSRYGDTPLGMVESALEFIRICESENYYGLVVSMKASNTQVMVQAYRLLVNKLESEGLKPYPLHLGVTEAGEGEDGRIKSAVGIGALLEDGLGDTVRVSLTEAPEFEAPVARALIDRYARRAELAKPIENLSVMPKSPFAYQKRHSRETLNLGGSNVPRAIADLSHIADLGMKDLNAVGHFYLPATDKWAMNDQGADFVFTGKNKAPFMLPNGLKEIQDADVWAAQAGTERNRAFPLFSKEGYAKSSEKHPELNFIRLSLPEMDGGTLAALAKDATAALLLYTENEHAYAELRRAFFKLYEAGVQSPVLVERDYRGAGMEQVQLFASTDIGGLLIDGLGDGILLKAPAAASEKAAVLADVKSYNALSFGILQAARTRMTKTEYISCPSCGRTLFDLQETTAMIRKRTEHLKGVKIGIMGCIVNGPGEMADADYGYVGSGKGKITLYKGQEVVKKSVPSEQAVDALIDIIRQNGAWIEPADHTDGISAF